VFTARYGPGPAHTVYLCVLCGFENKQRLFPYTTLTGFYNREGMFTARYGLDIHMNQFTFRPVQVKIPPTDCSCDTPPLLHHYSVSKCPGPLQSCVPSLHSPMSNLRCSHSHYFSVPSHLFPPSFPSFTLQQLT
jgi:hypothetical protein